MDFAEAIALAADVARLAARASLAVQQTTEAVQAAQAAGLSDIPDSAVQSALDMALLSRAAALGASADPTPGLVEAIKGGEPAAPDTPAAPPADAPAASDDSVAGGGQA